MLLTYALALALPPQTPASITATNLVVLAGNPGTGGPVNPRQKIVQKMLWSGTLMVDVNSPMPRQSTTLPELKPLPL